MTMRVLETPRLRLEPFEERHLSERYVGWLADPEVVRYSENRFRTHTLQSCREYMESFRGSHHFFFAIVAKDPELGHFGNINAYVDERHGVADVGIMVGERRAWGKGYGREAWEALLRYLLADRGLRKVTGGCIADNIAMVRIMRSSGMTEDGRRVRQNVYDGKEVDIVHFSAFAPSAAR